jgi:two-component system, response regulator PdtaR
MSPLTSPPAADATTRKNGTRQVLIVEDNSFIALGLRGDPEQLGHAVVGLASDAAEARQLFHAREPNLLLMDVRLGKDDGIELTRQLYAERPCPVVIVSAFSDAELVARATEVGVFGYLVKPVAPDALRVQIAVAVRRFDESQKLQQENRDLLTRLESRKAIEKAKGILMKRLNLDEEAAHRRLQLESQKRRINIAECAKRVIESEKMLGP